MNIVLLSPHFPTNFLNFSQALKKNGANVLGLADVSYDELPQTLKENLTEYYRVNDMHDYNEMLKACGYFIYKHGKIDRLESHNEYWLTTDAQLRTDFNIPGVKSNLIDSYKNKSSMKKVITKTGLAYPKGKVIKDIDEAKDFISNVGYPVVVKPDNGVGAASTYKIENEKDLDYFFAKWFFGDFIMEEFVEGIMLTFDGLVDKQGKPVFYTSHQYSQGIMEVVNNDDHVFYYSLRQIPKDLEEAGLALLKAFEVKERFFHFEFFRRDKDKKLSVLEVNMRPPGGLTMDMFNYACDIDMYQEWANIVTNGESLLEYERKYHCCYLGRKNYKSYALSHEKLLSEFNDIIVHHEAINSAFGRALGDIGYLVRSTSLDCIKDFVQQAHLS